MSPDQSPDSSHSNHAQSHAAAFFSHNWPLLFFGSLFLMMVSLPLILTGFLTLQGIALFVAFGLALALAVTQPGYLGLYMIALVAALFVFYPVHTFNTAGSFLVLLVLAFTVIGAAILPQRNRPSVNAAAAPVATASTPAPTTTEAPDPEAKKAKKHRPVAFDKSVAANGITIIYGTESGNAQGLSEMAETALKGDGYNVQVLDADKVDAKHLKAFSNLLIITSTWGDGDPPSNAIDLVADIKSPMGLDLSGIQFSICAIGDTNYEQFCQCGKDFDAALEKFGGKRFYNRIDCDLDFETPFKQWLEGVRSTLKSAGLKSQAEYVEEAAPAAEAVVA